jgi:hypothetical protein
MAAARRRMTQGPPFGPPEFPGGTDAYAEAPAQPLQQCCVLDDMNTHAWSRDVDCFVTVSYDEEGQELTIPISAQECKAISDRSSTPLPAVRGDTKEACAYQGLYPATETSYTSPACGVVWEVPPLEL